MTSRFSFVFFLFLSTLLYSQESSVTVDPNFLLGKFDYRISSDFVEVEKEHASKSIYLNAVVYTAFKEMAAAAKEEGINLKIVSGTRNFEEQKAIWERKWKKLDSLTPLERALSILEFSSMPATSRHHWGTDIDLNNLENSYFDEGRGKAEYQWLVNNAARFGFFQVYTSQDSGRTGYKEEKWHWSYLPLASKYLEQYNETIGYLQISGFEGSEFAEATAVITNFVNGISKELQHPLPLTALPEKVVSRASSVEE